MKCPPPLIFCKILKKNSDIFLSGLIFKLYSKFIYVKGNQISTNARNLSFFIFSLKINSASYSN